MGKKTFILGDHSIGVLIGKNNRMSTGRLQAKVDQSRQESIVHSVHVSPCS
jgi:hypothetical protein